jgi:hypothetical protein
VWLFPLVLACRHPDSDSDAPALDTAPAPIPTLPTTPGWTADEAEYGTGIGWGDVDGDGIADLVVASGNDMRAGPLSVWRGIAGDLPDPTPTQSFGEHFHGHIAVGDVDRDGFDDVIATHLLGDGGWDELGGFDLYRGSAAGLVPEPAWSDAGFDTFGAALGDVDGDGDLDLAVAVGEPYRHEPAPQRLYENRGGSFVLTWTSAEAVHALAVAFVDWDADGDLDLAFACSGAPHRVFGNDHGLSADPVWLADGDGFDGDAIAVGDVDGDGLPDVLVSDSTYAGGPGVVRLYAGPDRSLAATSDGPFPWSAVSLVDVDGDGLLDAVAGQWWGGLTAWSSADLSRPTWQSATSSVVEGFAWHDVDGDGYDDLAVSNWDPADGDWLFVRSTSP